MPGKDIFLSYAGEDRSRILPLARALQGTGWTVFWDRKIPTGKQWAEVLTNVGDGVYHIRQKSNAWCLSVPENSRRYPLVGTRRGPCGSWILSPVPERRPPAGVK